MGLGLESFLHLEKIDNYPYHAQSLKKEIFVFANCKSLRAKAAVKLCEQDPLVANECVDWVVNGWIAEVGDIQSI